MSIYFLLLLSFVSIDYWDHTVDHISCHLTLSIPKTCQSALETIIHFVFWHGLFILVVVVPKVFFLAESHVEPSKPKFYFFSMHVLVTFFCFPYYIRHLVRPFNLFVFSDSSLPRYFIHTQSEVNPHHFSFENQLFVLFWYP